MQGWGFWGEGDNLVFCEKKIFWPGGICGMPPGQHCPVYRSARRGENGTDAEAGKIVPLRGTGSQKGSADFAEGCHL